MSSGSSAKNTVKKKTQAERDQELASSLRNDSSMQDLLSQYASGNMSLQEAMDTAKQKRSEKYITNDEWSKLAKETNWKMGDAASEKRMKDAIGGREFMTNDNFGGIFDRVLQEELAKNPLTGTKMATEQIQKNPLLSEAFGDGGLMSRLGAEEKNLASTGFNLTEDDHTAYGQTAGDIARMFGQQEQSLSQALADRGLAAGSSGAAAASFSGLQGNKYEQLGKAQMDIAQRRYQDNMQRLSQTRNQLMGLTGQAQNELANQFSRNTGGVQMGWNQDQRQVDNDSRQKQIEQAQENTAWQQKQDSSFGFEDVLPAIGSVAGAVIGGPAGAAAGKTVLGGVANGVGGTGQGRSLADNSYWQNNPYSK